MVDEDKCNGCGWCIEACDYGAIMLQLDKEVVFVCDLCQGKPKFVEMCPEEALDFVTKDALAQKARITAVKKLFQESLEATTKSPSHSFLCCASVVVLDLIGGI